MKTFLGWLVTSILLMALSAGITLNLIAYQNDTTVIEIINPSQVSEFIIVDAATIFASPEANYNQLSKLDPAPADGTDRSVYIIYNGNLVKSDNITWQTIKICSEGSFKNVFAITKKERDMYYTLIRVTHNEYGCVTVEDL